MSFSFEEYNDKQLPKELKELSDILAFSYETRKKYFHRFVLCEQPLRKRVLLLF